MPHTPEGTGYRNTDTSHASAINAGASSTVYRVKIMAARTRADDRR